MACIVYLLKRVLLKRHTVLVVPFYVGKSRHYSFYDIISPERNCNFISVGLSLISSKGSWVYFWVVAYTLLPTQMFPRLPARATLVPDTNFVSGTKIVSDFVQKHFVSATKVSQFAQPKKHHGQQCVRNNVSSFTRALRAFEFKCIR